MQNHKLPKQELFVWKWVVMEKLRDYILASKYTIYTNKNLLVCVRKSKLGAAYIHWLGELALFDFNIKYWTVKTNKAADTLSCPPNTYYENFTDAKARSIRQSPLLPCVMT